MARAAGGALRRDIGSFPDGRPARRTVSECPVNRPLGNFPDPDFAGPSLAPLVR